MSDLYDNKGILNYMPDMGTVTIPLGTLPSTEGRKVGDVWVGESINGFAPVFEIDKSERVTGWQWTGWKQIHTTSTPPHGVSGTCDQGRGTIRGSQRTGESNSF